MGIGILTLDALLVLALEPVHWIAVVLNKLRAELILHILILGIICMIDHFPIIIKVKHNAVIIGRVIIELFGQRFSGKVPDKIRRVKRNVLCVPELVRADGISHGCDLRSERRGPGARHALLACPAVWKLRKSSCFIHLLALEEW